MWPAFSSSLGASASSAVLYLRPKIGALVLNKDASKKLNRKSIMNLRFRSSRLLTKFIQLAECRQRRDTAGKGAVLQTRQA